MFHRPGNPVRGEERHLAPVTSWHLAHWPAASPSTRSAGPASVGKTVTVRAVLMTRASTSEGARFSVTYDLEGATPTACGAPPRSFSDSHVHDVSPRRQLLARCPPRLQMELFAIALTDEALHVPRRRVLRGHPGTEEELVAGTIAFSPMSCCRCFSYKPHDSRPNPNRAPHHEEVQRRRTSNQLP